MSIELQANLFKVVCSDWNGAVRGRPYRKLAVDPKSSLAMLAEDILDAFGPEELPAPSTRHAPAEISSRLCSKEKRFESSAWPILADATNGFE